jgi:anti-sigma factor RsiW
MSAAFPHSDGRCDRAHQWSSLRLDGELSDLEIALLEKHLETCGACRAFDVQLRSTAAVVRETPAEAPARAFEVPARRRSVAVSRLVAVAAVVAAAALGSLVGSTLNSPAPQREKPVAQVSFLTRDLSDLRDIPRNRKIAPAAPARVPGGPPEGII